MIVPTYLQVPLFLWKNVDACASSTCCFARWLFPLAIRIGIGVLTRKIRVNCKCITPNVTYLRSLIHFFPRSLGSIGTIRSSARKRSCSLMSARRASKGANLPFNFETPTTRCTCVIFSATIRSLYSLCGSALRRQMEADLGQIEWGSVLTIYCQMCLCATCSENSHSDWFGRCIRIQRFDR